MTTQTPLPRLEVDEVLRGLGVLSVSREDQKIALPLAGVDLQARVADRVADVEMTQVFRNPHQEALEATYVFPLPGGAAVRALELKVGGRTLVGKVDERGEARRQYQEALQEGRRAALLEKERDDVFTASVGNLPPGEEVKLVIKWSERLPFFEDGTTEVRLPMVVAPRYIPGIALDRAGVGTGIEEDTDAVPDASRITPPRLAPGLDPKVSLSIAVEVLGGGLEDMRCSQHATRLSVGQDAVKISLARENERLNRDFVLRWRLAEDRLTTRLVASEEDGAAYGMLSLIPPARDGFLGVARDVVFVVDRSGSMSGPKMGSAARACDLLLSSLTPGDRFAVQAFDDQYEWLEDNGQRFFHADEAGLEKGQKYLRGIDARGGTELDGAMHQAIAAIAGRVSEEIRTPVIVLLTDGQIGDESRVLQRIQKDLGDARVFTVGIDTAVNEAFLKRLASLGGGTSAFVAPGEALEEALRVVAREIGTPLVVDIKVADVDAGVEVVAPQPIPDLFAGRAASVYLKMARPGRVRVTGTRTDGGAFDVTVAATRVEVPALAQLWAKARVADLEDRFRLHTGNESDLKREIIEIAVKHSLLTRFTAFVVVDREEIVNPTGRTRQVTQAVEMPDQWEMELGAPAPMQAFAAPPGMAMPAPMLAMAPGPCLPPPLARAKRASKQVVGGFAKRKQEAEADASAAPPEPAPPAGRMGPVPGFAGGGGAAKPGMAPPSPPPSLAEAPPAREEAKPADVADVHAALDAFAKALEAARKALSEGTVPPVAQLEQARKALLGALAAAAQADRYPALQRFLRAAALELVAALGAKGVTAPSLVGLFERHAAAFAQARKEVGAAPAPFWESNV